MTNQASAIIVADSINRYGNRLTTFQLRYWRPIHSELMTHRKFSRSAGSSRARPSQKIIDQVRDNPWGPIHWGKNEPGMQANAELEGEALKDAQYHWKLAAYNASLSAEYMLNHGAHKQIVNRLLEPFTYIDVLVTATEYANWFKLRDHPDAQPEIRELAQLMRQAYRESLPTQVFGGQWHLPYITKDDWYMAEEFIFHSRGTRSLLTFAEKLEVVRKISVARCARVSYKAFDGTVAPIEKDLELYDQLLVSEPLHASPAEHQATPDEMQWIQTLAVASPEDYRNGDQDEEILDTSECWLHPELHGNFTGWKQYRKMLPNEYLPG